MSQIIEAKDLVFQYEGSTVHSLDGFSISIEKGERVAFLGPNGAGKSTFFLSLNGIHPIQQGELKIDGEVVKYGKKDLQQLRGKVGIVFQDPDSQLFSASVLQEISFGPYNLGWSEEKIRKAVLEVAKQLELESFQDKPVHALSGGQKKQVSIADIVVMDPEIIILDEPAAYLDPKHSQIVHRILEELHQKGITILVSTHDVNYAYQWADRIVVVQDGKVIAQGQPEAVFRQKDMIEKANLETPMVLDMYDCLVENGQLEKTIAPRSLAELKQRLKNH